MKYSFWMFLMTLLATFLGCQPSVEQGVVGPAGQFGLRWPGEPFGLTLTDVDGDGAKDLLAVEHAQNHMQLFQQLKNQKGFVQNTPPFAGVGFHPGDVIPWPEAPGVLVVAGEGDGRIRSIERVAGKVPEFRIKTEVPERSPRYLNRFDWPGWGPSLVVSPYVNGVIVLLKGYDPISGAVKERIVVPLSQHRNTLRGAERVTVADVDGDGINELLLAFSATKEIMVIRYKGDEAPKADMLWKNETWGMPNEVTVLDIDQDGDLDLLVPDEAPPARINVLKNDGKMHFTEVTPIEFPGDVGIYELRTGVDKDGFTYLLGAGPGVVALYQLPKLGSVELDTPKRVIPWVRQGDLTRDMRFEDIDGDGWLDMVMGRVTSQENIWIAYGPLWERFDKLLKEGFKLN